MILFEVLVGLAILVFAIVDLKFQRIPSFITTAAILGVLVINPQNLVWGIAGLTFGIVLYELDFSQGQYLGGIADVKVMGLTGLMIHSIVQFGGFMACVGMLGLATAVFRQAYYRGRKMPKEFPFIPVLLVVYIITIAFGHFV